MTESTDQVCPYAAYSRFTAATARYPEILGRAYVALGLCDETCDELLGAIIEKRFGEAYFELGDGQWYACRLANEFGFQFFELVHAAKREYGQDINKGRDLIDDLIKAMMRVAGKIAGRVKKFERDRRLWDAAKTEAFKDALRGHLVEYIKLSMYMLDALWRNNPRDDGKPMNYDDLLRQNEAKLSARMERGTLQGEGDHR